MLPVHALQRFVDVLAQRRPTSCVAHSLKVHGYGRNNITTAKVQNQWMPKKNRCFKYHHGLMVVYEALCVGRWMFVILYNLSTVY